ncbi:hypothetical protein EBZ39_14115, partial [bacterium]|nr:hypothetical protein [bacterium]
MMARLLAPLVQVVFPHQCRLCLELIVPEDVFCAVCLRKVQPIVSAYLPVTKTIHLPVIGLSAYTDPLRQLVLKKFNGDRLASEQLARLLLQLSPLATIPVDVVVPVPLHWTRYAWRGFNQAVEMARVIARGKGARVCSCVMRKRKTSFQSRLKAAER